MRALRVIGLAEDGADLVLEDAASGELFTVPADERLRAAARGDLSRLGQLEIELEPQLRPREIQERIRGGSSVAQVAVAANTSVSKIERYAYPILLERSTMAEKARQSHPTIDGNPARKSLDELVMASLTDRGQNSAVRWDAYRDSDGWVVCVNWQAGRSENVAHWEIRTGPRTNTVKARDDAARDLINPAPRPLHTIADPSFVDIARRVPTTATATAVPPTTVAEQAAVGSGSSMPGSSMSGSSMSAEANGRGFSTASSRHPAGSRRALGDRLNEEQMVEQTVMDDRAGVQPPLPTPDVARTGTDSPPAHGSNERSHRKPQRPVMPGWEDVLLGGGHGSSRQ